MNRQLVLFSLLACVALMLQTVASKRVSCMWNPSGVLGSDACLYSSVPVIPNEVHEIVDWVLEYLDLGGFRCNEESRTGGKPTSYDIPDDINLICYSLMYEFDLSLPEAHLNFRVLLRGAWDRTPEEQEYKTCRAMCDYFKRATTISIHMVHARPRYLGCYHEENKNNEDFTDLTYPPEVTCDQYCGGGPCDNSGGGGGSAAPWIIFGVLMAALVVLVALGALFWWFKMRT